MKIQLQTQKVNSNINSANLNNRHTQSYSLNKNIGDTVSFTSSGSRRLKAGVMAVIAALGLTAGATTSARAASVDQKTEVTGSEYRLDDEDETDGYTVVKRDEKDRVLKKIDEKTGDAKYYTYFDLSDFYTIQYVRPDNIRYLLELYNLKTGQFIANDRCNHPSQWEQVYTGPTYDEPKPPVSIPEGAEADWNSTQFYLGIQERPNGANIEDYTIVDKNTLRVVSKESENPKDDVKFITVDENNQIVKEESYDEYFNRVLNLDDETSKWGAYQFIKNIEYNRQETGFNPGDKVYSVVDEHTVKSVTSGVSPEKQFVEYLVVDETGEVLYLYAIPPAPIPTPNP